MTPMIPLHAGHLGDLAGHDHWGLGLGLGAIAGAAVIGWLKGRKQGDKPTEPEGDQAESEEALA